MTSFQVQKLHSEFNLLQLKIIIFQIKSSVLQVQLLVNEFKVLQINFNVFEDHIRQTANSMEKVKHFNEMSEPNWYIVKLPTYTNPLGNPYQFHYLRNFP